LRAGTLARILLATGLGLTLAAVGLIALFQRKIEDTFDPATLIDVGVVAIILFLVQGAIANAATERTVEKELLTTEVRTAMQLSQEAQNAYESYAGDWENEGKGTALNRALKNLSSQLSLIERLAGQCDVTLQELGGKGLVTALLFKYRTATTGRFGQEPQPVEINDAMATGRAVYEALLMLIVDINRCR